MQEAPQKPLPQLDFPATLSQATQDQESCRKPARFHPSALKSQVSSPPEVKQWERKALRLPILTRVTRCCMTAGGLLSQRLIFSQHPSLVCPSRARKPHRYPETPGHLGTTSALLIPLFAPFLECIYFHSPWVGDLVRCTCFNSSTPTRARCQLQPSSGIIRMGIVVRVDGKLG